MKLKVVFLCTYYARLRVLVLWLWQIRVKLDPLCYTATDRVHRVELSAETGTVVLLVFLEVLVVVGEGNAVGRMELTVLDGRIELGQTLPSQESDVTE